MRTRIAPIFVAVVLSLFAAPAVAQDSEGPSGFGLGVSGNTTSSAFGLVLPIATSDSFRIEPTLMLGYAGISGGVSLATSVGEGQTVTSQSTATSFGLSIGFLSLVGNGAARGLVGAEVGSTFTTVSTTTTVVQVPSGDTSERTESTYVGATPFFRPVLGGEFTATDNIVIGLRAGPSFQLFVPDGDADTSFSFGGYGRVDAVYYF